MERIDGHIFLNDLLDECSSNAGLKVEVNYEGNDVGNVSGYHLLGDYLAVLEDDGSGMKNTDEVEAMLDGLDERDLERQLFLTNDGSVYIITSIDHIEFDEFNLIELYAEKIA